MSDYNKISYSETGNNTIEHFSYNIKDFDRTTIYGEYCDNDDFFVTSFIDTSKKSPTQTSIINETNDKLNNTKQKFCSTIKNELIKNKQKKDKIEILKNQIFKFDGTLTALEIEKEKELSYDTMANMYDKIYNKIDTANRQKKIQLNSIPYRDDPDINLQNAVNEYYNEVNNIEFTTYIADQRKQFDDFINMLQVDLLKLISDKYNDMIKLYNIVMTDFNKFDYSLSYIPDEGEDKISEYLKKLIISTAESVEFIINTESKLKDIKHITKDEAYSDNYQNSLLDLYKIEKTTIFNLSYLQESIDKIILDNGYDSYSISSILSSIIFLIILVLIIIFIIKHYKNINKSSTIKK